MYEIYEYKPNYVQLSIINQPNQFFIVDYNECLQFVRMGLIE